MSIASAALTLLALATPPGPAKLVPWSSLDETGIANVLASLAPLSLSQRLVQVSDRFVGTRYVVSPLGEGWGQDADPPVRYDAVDCLTFVEESLALSLVQEQTEIQPVLQRLRYDRQPTYEDRNHVMEAQWIPHNLAKGFIEDVTVRYGGPDAQRVQKTLTAQTWSSPSSRALNLPRERQPRGVFSWWMIPLERVLSHAPDVPSGTIVVIVREDRPYKVTRISHVGFLIQKRGRVFLRHAAQSVFARVVDEDLAHFLERNSRYDWKVVGVSLYRATGAK